MKLISSIPVVFFILIGQLAAEEISRQFEKVLILDFAKTGDHIIAVGERGHVLRGVQHPSWEKIQAPGSATLTAVWFSDAQQGWAVGHDATIIKTTDGGRNWRVVYQNAEAGGPLLDVWFKDPLQGIAIGAYGQYLTTHDGGETWRQEQFGDLLNAVDEAQKKNKDELVAVTDLHLNAIAQAVTGQLYIVAESGHIYRSDDDGQTWNQLPSPYAGSLFGILPLDREQLLVFGLRGHLFRSDDAGLTWKEMTTSTYELLMSAERLDQNEIMVAGMGGTLLISRDGGLTFSLHTLSSRRGLAAIIQDNNGHVLIGGEHGVAILQTDDP